jgi:beta-lactam-binding protein with PASTA domain
MGSRLKWTVGLVAGIAAFAGAGYLVAALVFFPSPLLPSERQVARVTGLSEDEATRELERLSLAAQVVGRETHPTLSAGRVIWQDPPPAVAVPRGSAVQLIVSAGPPGARVPDVTGYDLDFARRLLDAGGLRTDAVDSIPLKGLPSGVVGSTTPPAGDSVAAGRGVVVHLVP